MPIIFYIKETKQIRQTTFNFERECQWDKSRNMFFSCREARWKQPNGGTDNRVPIMCSLDVLYVKNA